MVNVRQCFNTQELYQGNDYRSDGVVTRRRSDGNAIVAMRLKTALGARDGEFGDSFHTGKVGNQINNDKCRQGNN